MKLRNFLTALALACAALLGGCGPEEPTKTPTGAPAGAPASSTAGDPEAGLERVLKPLPDSAFKAQVTAAGPPQKLARGDRADVTVRVRNTGDAVWPVRGREGDGVFQVNLGDRWIDSKGRDVKVDERVFLPRAVKPGEEVELPLAIVAPDAAGDYVVEVDMVQEGVAWFFQKGSQPLRLKVKVE